MDLMILKSLLKMQGRINRTEFLAYSFLVVATYFIIVISIYIASYEVFFVADTIAQFSAMVLLFLLVVGRVHDYNESAGYALLVLIPIVNLFVIFAAGEPAPNKYGPTRPIPSTLTKFLAVSYFLLPVAVLTLHRVFPELIEGISLR